jgi:hypothetical protein
MLCQICTLGAATNPGVRFWLGHRRLHRLAGRPLRRGRLRITLWWRKTHRTGSCSHRVPMMEATDASKRGPLPRTSMALNTDFTHRRERQLQSLDQMVNEVRVPVHRASRLDQCLSALLIYAPEPAGDGRGADQEGRGAQRARSTHGWPRAREWQADQRTRSEDDVAQEPEPTERP